MKVSTEKLRAKLDTMTVDELKDFAYNVVWVLYGTYHDQQDTCEPEPDTSFAQDEEVLHQELEWTQDNIEMVAAECDSAGITPEKL
jgi:hypothetical protein